MPGLPSKIELSQDILHTPIPDQSQAVELRAGGYDAVPVDKAHPLYSLENNPLVSLSDYGVDSQSYYSRQNTMGYPIPGVSPDVLVREDTARRVQLIDEFLRHTAWVKEFCGGEVRLYVRDGLRSKGLQEYVSKIHYPEFLRRKLEQQPGESGDEFEARVQVEAAKAISGAKNPPHATGGVVDIRIVRLDGDNDAVGYGYDHSLRHMIQTDYFEHHQDEPGAERYAQIRRLLFHAMAAVGGVVNPLEPWHFGFVDLADPDRTTDGLSAVTTGAAYRFYDSIEGMPDADPTLLKELRRVKAGE